MRHDPGLSLLAGVRIAAFTQFLLGPATCQYLADMGADVVKVEQPGTGAWERGWSGADMFVNGVSVFFMLANRNARSLTLNLKSAGGREAALRLIERSDVVVENFRPGVVDRLGIGYEQARLRNPRVVYASGSGYGSDGPYSHLPGQDLLIQAISGLGANTGTDAGGPTVAAAAVVDQHSASLLAMGILGALVNRERTGQGQRVELVMLQAALDLQTEPVVYHLNGASLRRPAGSGGDTFHAAPYGFFATADGHVAIAMTPVEVLSDALGHPAALEPFADAKVAFSRADEIREALRPLLMRRTTSEWIELFRARDVWCAPVDDLTQTFDDPAVRHADPVLEVEHPRAGRIRLLKHPVRYSSGEAALRRPPPELGQHTDEVLGELGFSAEQIRAMRAAGEV